MSQVKKHIAIKRILITLILAVAGNCLFSGILLSSQLDSLKTALNQNIPDTARISIFCDIAYNSILNDPDSVGYYADKALTLAGKTNNKYYKAIAYKAVGLAYWKSGVYSRSIQYLLLAYTAASNINNEKLKSAIAGNLGLVELKSGNYSSALQYGLQVRDHAVKTGDKELFKQSCTNIANAYDLLKKGDSAIVFYRQALDVCKETRDTMGIGNNLNNIAKILIDYDKKPEAAAKYIDSAFKIYKRYNYNTGLAKLFILKAEAYKNQRDYVKSLMYIDSAYNAGSLARDMTLISRIMELESVVLFAKEDYKKAFEILEDYMPVHDSLRFLFDRDKVDSMIYFYREQYKDRQIKLLEVRSKQSRIITIFLILLIGFLFFIAYLLYSRNRSGRKSLDTIRAKSLIIEDQKRELEKVLSSLQERNNMILQQNKDLESLNIELKESNSLKDRFLSVIAHDLRNPIGALTSLTSMVYDSYAEFSEAEKLEILASMKDSAKSVYELLENLLTWSRLHRGRIEFHPEEVSLHFLINNTINPLNLQAKNKSIIIENQVEDRAVVYADPNMLSTIIRNIVTNALKFSPENTTIIIKSRKYNLHSTISISDNGVGMRPETLHQLFENEVSSMTGTASERGTGLGLVLCKEFVEIHGGKIWVQSIIGKGSTFYFTVPAKKDTDSSVE